MQRGYRDASHVADHGLLGRGDHLVLPTLRRASPPVVLVTGDNKMPHQHEGLLRLLRLPFAIVDSRGDRGELTVNEYQFDVVQRWAHQIVRLPPSAVVWYRRTSFTAASIDNLPSLHRRRRRATDEVVGGERRRRGAGVGDLDVAAPSPAPPPGQLALED